MAEQVRNRPELLAQFADNVTGEISAEDGRDLIMTAFGHWSTSNPTVNNDEDDTAGLGVKFSVGSLWVNTNAFKVWRCCRSTAGAAIWREEGPAGPTGPQGPQGDPGADGEGVPTGGTAGQHLVKDSGTDFDTSWQDDDGKLPTGGAAGEHLVKQSGADFDADWEPLALVVENLENLPPGDMTTFVFSATSVWVKITLTFADFDAPSPAVAVTIIDDMPVGTFVHASFIWITEAFLDSGGTTASSGTMGFDYNPGELNSAFTPSDDDTIWPTSLTLYPNGLTTPQDLKVYLSSAFDLEDYVQGEMEIYLLLSNPLM